MIVKVNVENLMVGMYVVDTGLSWIEHPYLYSQEGRVQSRKQVDDLVAEGYAEVFIDTVKSGLPPEAFQGLTGPAGVEEAVAGDVADEPVGAKRVPVSQELGVAKRVYDDSLKFARDFIGKAYAEKQVDLERSEEFVEDVIGSVIRNRDALLGLCKLRIYDEYTYTHSINVTVLSTAFGEFLGLPEAELRPLGLAALFHDVGKANIPRKVLNKPGKLTEEEFEVIKRHPAESYGIVKIHRSLPSKVLLGIVEHHEKYNGHGYPRALSGDQINLFARIISLADVYDALTSERVYKSGMAPAKALGVIYGMREQDFHPAMAERFIKCMGVYPVGCFVRLNDGRHGVVYSSNAQAPLSPVVKAAFDPEMRPIPPQLLDLTRNGHGLKIVETVDPRPYNIDMAVLFA